MIHLWRFHVETTTFLTLSKYIHVWPFFIRAKWSTVCRRNQDGPVEPHELLHSIQSFKLQAKEWNWLLSSFLVYNSKPTSEMISTLMFENQGQPPEYQMTACWNIKRALKHRSDLRGNLIRKLQKLVSPPEMAPLSKIRGATPSQTHCNYRTLKNWAVNPRNPTNTTTFGCPGRPGRRSATAAARKGHMSRWGGCPSKPWNKSEKHIQDCFTTKNTQM